MEFLESGGVPELAEELQNYRQAAEKDIDEAENLELRPEEHESYQGDEDNQDEEVWINLWCVINKKINSSLSTV